jgi:hypothetical protein
MRFPARRNLGAWNCKISLYRAKTGGNFLDKTRLWCSLGGREAWRNGAVRPQRPPEIPGEWLEPRTKSGLALSK